MERLVHFGQALGRSLDIDAIRDVVVQHLPKLAGTSDGWVILRSNGQWQPLVGATAEGQEEVQRTRQHIANRALVSNSAWTPNAVVRTSTAPSLS